MVTHDNDTDSDLAFPLPPLGGGIPLSPTPWAPPYDAI